MRRIGIPKITIIVLCILHFYSNTLKLDMVMVPLTFHSPRWYETYLDGLTGLKIKILLWNWLIINHTSYNDELPLYRGKENNFLKL